MEGSGFKIIQQNGEYGNLCAGVSEFTATSVPVGRIIKLFSMPPDCYVTELTLVSDGLGAGVTARVGYEQKGMEKAGGNDQFHTDIDVENSGRHTFQGFPLELGKPVSSDNSAVENPGKVVIYATLAGAVANGRISCIVNYVYLGTR